MTDRDSPIGRSALVSSERRTGQAAVLIGAAVLVLACLGAGATLRRLGNITVPVRPATAAEAPERSQTAHTVVAAPDGTASVWPAVKGTLIRLLVLGAAAAIGAGIATWGVASVLAARTRDTDGHEQART